MNSLYGSFWKQVCRLETCVVIAAGIITANILFIGPVTGVANNGDYIRIMRLTGLQFITDSRFTNIDLYFKFAQSTVLPSQSFLTSHVLPIEAAKLLNVIFKSSGVFDLRFLGITFSSLFLIGIYLLYKSHRSGRFLPDLALGLMLLLVLCDVGYVSYFNSFFGEAAVYVFFILTAGFASWIFVKRKITIPLIACFLLSSLLFISARQANAVLGILIGMLLPTVLFVDRRPRITASVIVSTLALIVASVYLSVSVPEKMERITKHQTVFYGILKNSATPEADLEFLGLDRKLAVLKEVSFYEKTPPIPPGSEWMEKEFYSRITFFDVLRFYLSHPDRFLEKLEITAKNSTMIRAPYLGNFLFGDIHERFDLSGEFSFWSSFKKTHMPNDLWFVAVFFLLYLAWLARRIFMAATGARDRPSLLKTGLFSVLWATGASQFIIPILGDGEVDLEKHLFLYNLCFDLMLLSSVMGFLNRGGKAVRALTERWREKPLSGRLKSIAGALLPFVSLSISITILSAGGIHTGSSEDASGGTSSAAAETGDYLRFGRFDGEELLWRVIHKEGGRLLLMADKVVCFRAFDDGGGQEENSERKKYGSNDWETSSLREWLNSRDGFLSGFTPSEREAVQPVVHKSILATADLDKKEGGSGYYLWSNCIPLLMQNYNRAFYRMVQDSVFLPDVRELKEYVSDNGFSARKKASLRAIQASGENLNGRQFAEYWLRTPYATKVSSVRTVGSDGFVYYKDAACDEIGVLPVLCLKAGSPAGMAGKG